MSLMGREASYWDKPPEEEQKVEITEEYLESIRHSGKEIGEDEIKRIAEYLIEHPRAIEVDGIWYGVGKDETKKPTLYCLNKEGVVSAVSLSRGEVNFRKFNKISEYAALLLYFGYVTFNELWNLHGQENDVPWRDTVSSTLLQLKEQLSDTALIINSRPSGKSLAYRRRMSATGFYVGNIEEHRKKAIISKNGWSLNEMTGAFYSEEETLSVPLTGIQFEIIRLTMTRPGAVNRDFLTSHFEMNRITLNTHIGRLQKKINKIGADLKSEGWGTDAVIDITVRGS